MNTIIPLNGLVARLALRENISEEQARDFVIHFFNTIEQSLAYGENVSVKGFGNFTIANRTVVFDPDPAFAAQVNEPFDMFMPMELDDDFDSSIIDEDDTAVQPPVFASRPEPKPAAVTPSEADKPKEETKEEPKAEEPMPRQAPVREPEPIEQTTPFVEPEPLTNKQQMAEEKKPETQPQEQYETPATTPQPTEEPATEMRGCTCSRISRCCVALWALGGLIVGLVLGIWIGYKIHDKIAIVVSDTPAAPGDSIMEILQPVDTMPVIITEEEINNLNDPTTDPERISGAVSGARGVTKVQPSAAQPSATAKQPRTDTVTKTRYLTNMAREYYGNEAYWVYIFKANQDKLPTLNSYIPGTVIVIPEFEEFRTSDNPAQNLADAVKLGTEIYAGN